MKIKEQTRKLAVGYPKNYFEVVDKTDEVSNHTYGKVNLKWFEFEYKLSFRKGAYNESLSACKYRDL